MTTVAVYTTCRSKAPLWLHQLAAQVGQLVAEQGWSLVYGGGADGPQGWVAAAAAENGASVTAVTRPRWVQDVDHGWDRLVLRESLCERNAVLEDLADGFLILPGGSGTLAELASVLAAAGNGEGKPFVVCDPYDLFAPVWRLAAAMVEFGLAGPIAASTCWTAPAAVSQLAVQMLPRVGI